MFTNIACTWFATCFEVVVAAGAADAAGGCLSQYWKKQKAKQGEAESMAGCAMSFWLVLFSSKV